MLKRSSLTEQAKVHLKQRIRNAEFADGRIPSELELAEQLGVSRTTIRSALTQLESEGAIVRRQGAGTFVNSHSLQLRMRLEEIWSYEGMLRAHGFTPSTRILAVEQGVMAPDLSADFELPPTAPFVVVHKLFLQDEQPVILTVNRIPQATIVEPFTADDFCPPIFEFLAKHCHRRLTYYFSDIVPLTAEGKVAERLCLPVGAPLIAFEETGFDSDNRPTIFTHSYFRDDLLRLRLIRREP